MSSDKEEEQKTFKNIFPYVKPVHISIADAFAFLGGNTYFFAEAFANVSAYEIDETRREYLKENIKEFYKRSNVDVYADWVDGENNIFKKYHDAVFLDPPWLNPETKVVDSFVFEYVDKICERLAKTITRMKRGRDVPTYTIICARLKPLRVGEVDWENQKLDVRVLLQQLKIMDEMND